MGTPKSITNGITRRMLDTRIKSLPVGSELNATILAEQLSTRRRSVSARVLGNLLSERNDIELKDRNNGTWIKTMEENT